MIKKIYLSLCFCIAATAAEPILGPLTQMNQFQVELLGEAAREDSFKEVVEIFRQIGTVNVGEEFSQLEALPPPLIFLSVQKNQETLSGFLRVYGEVSILANQYKTISKIWSIEEQGNPVSENSNQAFISNVKNMVANFSEDYYRENPSSSQLIFNFIPPRSN